MEVQKELSGELDLKFTMANGKIALELTSDTKGVDTTIKVAVEPEYFITKLAEAFPKAGPYLAPVLRLVLAAT